MYRVIKKIGKISDKLQKNKLAEKNEKNPKNRPPRPVDEEAQQVIPEADVVAGFITFEYCESMKRCVADYSYYNSFPRRLFFYPSKFKFRGKKIKVEKAPDPDEIIWEHLEVSGISKRFRRFGTSVVSGILIIISFAAILQSSIYKGVFAARIPAADLCSRGIPSLFGAYGNVTDYSDFKFERPVSDSTEDFDSQCNAINGGSFYAVYSTEGDPTNPVTSYDFQACNSSAINPEYFYDARSASNAVAGGLCPNYGQKVFCPCISKTSRSTCQTLACSGTGTNAVCENFAANALSSCYCQQKLNAILTSGIAKAVTYIRSTATSTRADSCSVFFTDYSTAQGVSYGTILVSITANTILIYLTKWLTTFEAHVSTNRENAQLMIKTFIFTYVNMAFTVLIAFGRISDMPDALKVIYIFQGQYTDFSSDWYTSTGVYFLTSFLITSAVDIAKKVFAFFIVIPIKRICIYPFIRRQSSHSVVLQYELDQLQIGPLFHLSQKNAHFLSMLFFAMTYAAGLPMLMPMAFVTLSVLFQVDRLLLLRFNQKPPLVGDGMMQIIMKILPFAAIIRLAFACWMFSFPVIFKAIRSDSVVLQYYDDWLIRSRQRYVDWLSNRSDNAAGESALGITTLTDTIFILDRVFNPNVFPLLLLLAFIIFLSAVQLLWKFLPFYWINRIWKSFLVIAQRCLYWKSRLTKVHIASLESPNSIEAEDESEIRILEVEGKPLLDSAPFTGQYFCYLPDKLRGDRRAGYCCDRCCDTVTAMRDKFKKKQSEEQQDSKDGWHTVEGTVMEEGETQGQVLEQGLRYKVKKWTHASFSDGVVRAKGDTKMTYEVIQDSGSSSYALENIPAYKMVIQGLKEGSYLLTNTKFEREESLKRINERKNLCSRFFN
jgi:hypothetical protein